APGAVGRADPGAAPPAQAAALAPRWARPGAAGRAGGGGDSGGAGARRRVRWRRGSGEAAARPGGVRQDRPTDGRVAGEWAGGKVRGRWQLRDLPSWVETDFLMKNPERSVPARAVWLSKALTKPAPFSLGNTNEGDPGTFNWEAKDISV
ncbi:hypothetical protein MC885_007818, partial [Smutsia gigantea]